MAPKSNKNAHKFGSSKATSPSKSLSTYNVGNNSYEMNKTSKIIKKDKYSGCSSTTKFSQTTKCGEFIDKQSGDNAYTEELKFQTTHRFSDKAKGYTKEYETEVKFKETTTYHKSNSSSSKNYSYKKLIGDVLRNMD